MDNDFKFQKYHLLELIPLPYYMAILITASSKGEAFGIPFKNWIGHFVSSTIIALILLLFIYWKFQLNDARVRLVFHLANLIFMSVTYGKIDEYTGINDPDTVLTPTVLINYVIVFLPVVLVWLGTFLALLNTFEVWERNVRTFSSKISNHDYHARLDDPQILKDGFFKIVADLLNTMAEKNQHYLESLKAAQDQIEKTSISINADIEEVAASAEQITATSGAMAQTSSTQAEQLSQLLETIHSKQQEIAEVLETMLKKTSLIDEIAIQTNILSLNAGIEASRAGDYGRGFAVVAQNILKLAEQTQQTVDEVKQTINQVTSHLSTMIDGIRENVENLAAIAQESAASSEEVAAAAKEIASSLQNLTELTNQLRNEVEKSATLL
ncbi:MAG: hypothetical protein D6732_15105 [Methanobacteriota archaeon]|nr:MAG: hypothetical protein D6732_15105 [Euryarchaeota archaeon]